MAEDTRYKAGQGFAEINNKEIKNQYWSQEEQGHSLSK